MIQSAAALNRSFAADAPSQRRQSILTSAVTQDVIPRLLGQRLPQRRAAISLRQITALAELTLNEDGPAAVAFVVTLLEQGVPAETLYLDLLSPVAILLGQYWVDDVCNFADVTIGLGHLHQVLRALGPAFLGRAAFAVPNGPRAFLLPLPGEQHAFGLTMLADFFRRAGWNTWSGVVATSDELCATVATEWVDLLGFSLACQDMLEVATAEIAAVRRASRNPDLVVMVGGPPFVDQPALAGQVGADGTAADGLRAVTAAEALLPARLRRR